MKRIHHCTRTRARFSRRANRQVYVVFTYAITFFLHSCHIRLRICLLGAFVVLEDVECHFILYDGISEYIEISSS